MNIVTPWHRHVASGIASIPSGLFDQSREPEEDAPRFTVVDRGGQCVVHDSQDGSYTTAMRKSSAIHLAQQFNKQAAQERTFAAIHEQTQAEARAIVRGEA
jgi:hypothetical protein